MTYNDLCEEVKELGFESAIDSPARMLSAARRAQREIYSIRPVFSNAVIYQRIPKPIQHIKELASKGDGEISVPYSSAKAFSFRSTGVGSVTVRETGKEHTLTFSGLSSVTKEFLHGDGELIFKGEYSFTVTELAIFGEIVSGSTEDIPVADMPREYDMAALVEGFISLAAPPSDSFGRIISGASLCGDLLTVPSDYSGDVCLICKRGRELSEEGELDIPAECEPLLALLTASYYWLDDDPEKAQYYRSLYHEGMNTLRYNNRGRMSPSSVTGNGWA